MTKKVNWFAILIEVAKVILAGLAGAGGASLGM